MSNSTDSGFPSATLLRLGTRGSTLARMQSQLMANALEQRHTGLRVELRVFTTTGDQVTDRPLHEAGGKGLFTKELELALLDGQIDLAVHSYKDVPVTMPLVDSASLVIAATPPREDPRDVLITRTGARRLVDLPNGASVATGSLRRTCQITEARPDLRLQPIRGNIDTRLRKLAEGKHDALILALAGLRRAGLYDDTWMTPLAIEEVLPAPAQGALAIQCRRDDARTIQLVRALHHEPTEICVGAERELVKRLGGDCHSPIAALATQVGEELDFRAAVGARGGKPPVLHARVYGPMAHPGAVVDHVYNQLRERNVESLLRDGR